MERIRRTNQQMEPCQITMPVPDQVADREPHDDENDVERKEIRREGDEEIRFGNDHVPAFGRDLHLFDPPAKQPRPEGMRQFMAKNVNPHRLRQQQVDDNPARHARQKRNPGGIGAAAGSQHFQQCQARAGTNRQQQNGNDELDPLRHARKTSYTDPERTEEKLTLQNAPRRGGNFCFEVKALELTSRRDDSKRSSPDFPEFGCVTRRTFYFAQRAAQPAILPVRPRPPADAS